MFYVCPVNQAMRSGRCCLFGEREQNQVRNRKRTQCSAWSKGFFDLSLPQKGVRRQVRTWLGRRTFLMWNDEVFGYD